MKRILTVIVTYNGMNWIERCISSVLASTVPSDVMVIDNRSSDGTPEWVGGHFPEVILIRNTDNMGFAAANNIGLRYALEQGFEFVYLLNQDAWVFPDTFETIVSALGKPGCDIGIASPVQMTADLSEMDEQFKKHCSAAIAGCSSETVRVPFVMAAHWMITGECLRVTGGFSPAFPHYGEDNDYIHRAEWHGFGTAVVRTARAVHDRSSRPRPVAYRMKLKVINARVAVADPRKKPFASLVTETLKLAIHGILNFSIIPWKGAVELWTGYAALKDYRGKGRSEGAFLQDARTE